MASKTMTVPKVINVGYQERKDTYTGKLAFVVYTDEKGVVRKESSWKRWCDSDIPKDEFKNEPTEGFVLNKKVGDYRGGWNGRKAWCRIYDPRGFEFEITVQNLLFILEECTSVKGKGLEGELVYAWDGTQLVLLPVSSQEYEHCVEFTKHKNAKVTKADMKEGYIYLMKDMTEVMYMGRNEWFELHRDYEESTQRVIVSIVSKGKKHVFLQLTDPTKDSYRAVQKGEFFTQAGFTKLAKCISDAPSSDFPAKFDEFKKGDNGCGATAAGVKEIPKNQLYQSMKGHGFFNREHFVVGDDGKVYLTHIERSYDRTSRQYNGNFFLKQATDPVLLNGATCSVPQRHFYHSFSLGYRHMSGKECTKEELMAMPFCKVILVNEAGTQFPVY